MIVQRKKERKKERKKDEIINSIKKRRSYK